MNSSNLDQKESQMEYKFKVGDKVSTKQPQAKTMWALVLKSAPKVINHIDDLFMTRDEARKEKSKDDLTAFKVVKVTLTWEG